MLGRYSKVTDKNYPMSSLLKFQLDIMANNLAHDFDCIIVIDGEIEGSGKSVFGQQIGYYMSYLFKQQFTEDNIVFTPREFKDAVLKAPKYSSVVWDEAYQGSSKYRMMSGINQTIQSLLQQIRQRNLFIAVIVPYIFDLTSYIAVPRSWFLLHVFLKSAFGSEDDLEAAQSTKINPLDFNAPVIQRGFFRFYSRKRKKQLFFVGRREYNYSAAQGNFVGTFPRHYCVDETRYKEKKARIAFDEEGKEEMSDTDFAKECFKRGMPVPILKGYVNCGADYLYRLRKTWTANREVTG